MHVGQLRLQCLYFGLQLAGFLWHDSGFEAVYVRLESIYFIQSAGLDSWAFSWAFWESAVDKTAVVFVKVGCIFLQIAISAVVFVLWEGRSEEVFVLLSCQRFDLRRRVLVAWFASWSYSISHFLQIHLFILGEHSVCGSSIWWLESVLRASLVMLPEQRCLWGLRDLCHASALASIFIWVVEVSPGLLAQELVGLEHSPGFAGILSSWMWSCPFAWFALQLCDPGKTFHWEIGWEIRAIS